MSEFVPDVYYAMDLVRKTDLLLWFYHNPGHRDLNRYLTFVIFLQIARSKAFKNHKFFWISSLLYNSS